MGSRRVTKTRRVENTDGVTRTKSRHNYDRKKQQHVTDIRWFLTPLDEADRNGGHDVHTRVWAVKERLRPFQHARRRWCLWLSCLYEDAEMAALSPGGYATATFEPSTLSLNVVRPIVDTFVSRVAKGDVVPTPLTTGGNWAQQQRAKKLGKYFAGRFDQLGVAKMSKIVARDAALFGTGFTYNYRVGRRMRHERVFPWEIDVDPIDAQHGTPRCIYLTRRVDKLALIERFPDFADKIESAETGDVSELQGAVLSDESDSVTVVETWHLPSGDLDEEGNLEISGEPNDGRHAICISNATLVFEKYKRAYFPVGRYVIAEPLQGYFGTGLGRPLSGLQYAVNEAAEVVQHRQHLSGAYIMVQSESGIVAEHLDNDPGVKVLTYDGNQPPQFVAPSHVSPDSWNYVMSLLPLANRISRVSEMAMHGDKPAGIQSGRALQELTDNQDAGWAIASENLDAYHVELGWQFFDLEEDIAKEHGPQRVKTIGRAYGVRQAEDLEWSEVRLDRDSFTLAVFPTSALPRTPAAKTEAVQEFANAGWLGPDEAKEMLGFPDFEGMYNRKRAAYHLVQRLIDRFLSAKDPEADDVYVYPEPEFNLDLCISMAQEAYNEGKENAVPEGNLRLLLQFIADARAERKKKAAEVPPPPPPAGPGLAAAPIPGTPGPPPMPTPTGPAAPPIAA